MRTAIISDIHGNIVAFRSFLAAVEQSDIERIICLGDLVGYNPWPNECIRTIREKSIACVMGNHDRVAAGLEEPEHFNSVARDAILWTRRVLEDDHREFLSNLPDHLFIGDSIILVHGSPRNPDEYILSTGIARENMAYMEKQLGVSIGFFGHTHVSAFFDEALDEIYPSDGELLLEKGGFFLINPGSIGQPRDGDPRAAFLVFDYERRTIEFCRVDYNINEVNQAIVREGLSPFLGKRLFLGR